MSSIIEEIDSSARINNPANDDKSYKSKKFHKNKKDNFINFCSHEILQSRQSGSGSSNNLVNNFNCNGNNESDSLNYEYLNSHFSESEANQFENSDGISKTLSQFTFLDNDVPSQKDFPFMAISKGPAPSIQCVEGTNNEDSISKLTSSDNKNKAAGDLTKINDFMIEKNSADIHHSIEKKDKEKVSEKPKNEGSKNEEQVDGSCIEYILYESELQMPQIMKLITNDLSEPYSIYTYRYFIHNWPKLCFLAMCGQECVGVIVCKLDYHKKVIKRGYIAMLAVAQSQRRKGIGSHLVVRAIQSMVADNCDEVVLETEITNRAALHLYENLGFVRDKRLFRYYLNGVDALRLKLWLK